MQAKNPERASQTQLLHVFSDIKGRLSGTCSVHEAIPGLVKRQPGGQPALFFRVRTHLKAFLSQFLQLYGKPQLHVLLSKLD